MDIVVLGAGYVGSRLVAHLRARGAKVVATRRSVAEGDFNVRFDLEKEDTWHALPKARTLIVTFPPLLNTFQKFYSYWRKENPTATTIVFGSTSRYIADHPDEVVSESSKIDLSQPRVLGENFLQDEGATVLVLSGIMGPGRDPASWIQRGLIKNGNRTANLIHVDDIIAVTDQVIQRPSDFAGQAFNVSNGEFPSYADIAVVAKLTPPPHLPRDTSSRRVDISKLKSQVPSDWRWKSFSNLQETEPSR